MTCDRCGRAGRINFQLVDRLADGSEQLRCVHERPCMAQTVDRPPRRST